MYKLSSLKWVWIALAFVLPLTASAATTSVADPPTAVYPTVDYGTGPLAEQVKRGEYLAKAGDCIACHTHTTEGGKAFAGGLPVETPFGTI